MAGLTNNVTVTFAVRARNVAGPGGWSPESNSVTPAAGAALTLIAGGGQSTFPIQLFASELRFELRNPQGQPVPSELITFTADTGAVVAPATAMTNSLGQASVSVRASRLIGLMGVTATAASGPSLTVQLTVARPPPGTLVPITNVGNNAGSTFSPRAFELGIGASSLVLGSGGALSVARDGTLYLANNQCELLRVSREGVVSYLTGPHPNMSCSNSAGDGMPAASARFDTISTLVLDEARQRLYVRTQQGGAFSSGHSRIRSVPLDGGLVSTLAGSQSTAVVTGPGFGDDGDASQASIGGAGGLALSPDGRSLWFLDSGAQRIRRIDLDASPPLVTSVFRQCTFTPGSFANLDFRSPLAVTRSGQLAFFATQSASGACSTSSTTQEFLWAGVGGQPRPVSSETNSPLITSGANARQVRVPRGSIAFDEAGNLIFAPDGTGAVYEVDGATSVARILTGTGSLTNGTGPASAFELSQVRDFAFDAEGTLYFLGASANGTPGVRAVFGAGRTQPTAVTLSPTMGSGQQVRASDRAGTMTASLSVGGVPVPNVRVDWTSPGGVVAFPTPLTVTNAQGIVSATAWMPRRARMVDAQAQVVGLTGEVVTSLSFPMQVVAPDAGVVSTIGNVVRSTNRVLPAAPTPAAFVGGLSGDNLDTDATGVIYVSVGIGGGSGTDDFIARIDLDGVTTAIRPPVPNNSPMAVAYHRTRDRLYYVVQGGQGSGPADSSRIYEWVPPAGPSTLVAGGAARSVLDGDGANGTSAWIGPPTRIAAGPGNTLFIWDGQNNRIRVLDLTTGGIDAWARFQMASSCSSGVVFSIATPVPRRFINFNAAGTAWVWATSCATNRRAIVEVPPSAPPLVWAETPFSTGFAPVSLDLLLEPSGDLLFTDVGGARVSRIDAQTRASTVVLGTGSPDTPDWSPPLMTGINTPTALAPFPQGRFLVVTGETVRAVW